MDSAACSSSSASAAMPASASSASGAALAVRAEPTARARSEAEHCARQLGEGGGRAIAARPGQGRFQWPARSCARLRAGLRSALKTECSGFKFQNGGRSLRWFREHPADAKERARLFWQGHVRLFDHQWDLVKCVQGVLLFTCLSGVDRAFRTLYRVRDQASRSADRSHAQAMLADGCVERSLRWVLARCSMTESTLFSPMRSHPQMLLLGLALDGEWTWLLERWQAAVESSHGESKWRAMLAAGAVETGSLALVQKHWPYVQDGYRQSADILHAVGRSGSLEVFDWLVEHGFVADDPELNGGQDWLSLIVPAFVFGNVALVDYVLSRDSPAHEKFNGTSANLFFECSCMAGHLHAVEWLLNRDRVPGKLAFGYAVAGANLSTMCYLREHVELADTPYLTLHLETLLSRSRPDCLSVLEYLWQHYKYTPTSKHIARAATAANVRSDVLRFLAKHATQGVWASALTDEAVRGDLDVQDLLRAAAHAVVPPTGLA